MSLTQAGAEMSAMAAVLHSWDADMCCVSEWAATCGLHSAMTKPLCFTRA